MVAAPSLPDPAVVVLAGAAGSGKSTWAAERPHLRDRGVGCVAGHRRKWPGGSGCLGRRIRVARHDCEARIGRSLTTVIDTLGLDHPRRLGYLQLARSAGLPAVLVIMNTSPQLCRERNRLRDRPVPAPILAEQLQDQVDGRHGGRRRLGPSADHRGFRHRGNDAARHGADRREHGPARRPRVILHVSRFPWGSDLRGGWSISRWRGFHRLRRDFPDGSSDPDSSGRPSVGADPRAVGDPRNVGRPRHQASAGTLVSPVTFRAPGIIAKMVATLDALSGGRAFCGLGPAGGSVSTRRTDWTSPSRPSVLINCSGVSKRCGHSGHPVPRPTPDDI